MFAPDALKLIKPASASLVLLEDDLRALLAVTYGFLSFITAMAAVAVYAASALTSCDTANQGKTHIGNTTSLVTITSCTANAETVLKNTVGIE